MSGPNFTTTCHTERLVYGGGGGACVRTCVRACVRVCVCVCVCVCVVEGGVEGWVPSLSEQHPKNILKPQK